MGRNRFYWLQNRSLTRWIILAVTSFLSALVLIFPVAIRPSSYPLQVGDVANQDIQAPTTLTYTSDLLTDQARKDAEAVVSKIYLPADPNITRTQIEKMRLSLNYITSIRADTYSTTQQKIADINGLSDPLLSDSLTKLILGLSDTRWEAIQQESLNVLEQVMRNTIRDYQLVDARRNIPTLISLSFPQEQATIVADLVSQFVAPNSLYSEELTNDARAQAQEAVTPVERKYVAGQTLVQRGQIITPAIMEALRQFGLAEPKQDSQKIIASLSLIALLSIFSVIYFSRSKFRSLKDIKSLALIAAFFIIFLYGAKIVIPNRTVMPYLFPLAAFGMTIASLYTMELGMIFSLILSILAAYGVQNSLDLLLFYTMSSLLSILILGKGRRLSSFFWAGMAVWAAGSAIILAFRLSDTLTDWIGIITLIGAALANGLFAGSLTLLLQYFFSQALGLTTAMQLLEYARPDHPLLQYVLRNAPGSYQHSLQVSNLAEQAAESIRADGLLVRVGAIYHDSGKATNPSFFIENQVPGYLNPHDDLDPAISAATIIRHVGDGVQLARKYKLSPRIQDFIREHHGTLLTRYQYTKAVQNAGGNQDSVDPNQFRYPGPRPQSRETALLMLADGCEARARAELPKNESEIRILVKKIFDFCQSEGQLDDTSLTLRDLNLAKESFVKTLLNTHHPRIQYPELKQQNTPPSESPEIRTIQADTIPLIKND